jgi:succinate dehydrogenase/fumarate reductase flavoprotein subunit
MKETILNALKEKFQGLNDNVLERAANKLIKEIKNVDNVKDTVDNYTFQQLLDSYTDSRVTEAQQTAIKNYEQKYSLKDGKTLTPNNTLDTNKEINKVEETIPSWAKELIDNNKKLQTELQSYKNEKVAISRKEQINKAIQSLPQNIQKIYARIPINDYDNDGFNNLLNEITTEASDLNKSLSQSKVVFNKPLGINDNTNQATSDETDAVLKKLAL